jgi:hypothetical protein
MRHAPQVTGLTAGTSYRILLQNHDRARRGGTSSGRPRRLNNALSGGRGVRASGRKLTDMDTMILALAAASTTILVAPLAIISAGIHRQERAGSIDTRHCSGSARTRPRAWRQCSSSALTWADPASPPPDTVDYTAAILDALRRGIPFTLDGW